MDVVVHLVYYLSLVLNGGAVASLHLNHVVLLHRRLTHTTSLYVCADRGDG